MFRQGISRISGKARQNISSFCVLLLLCTFFLLSCSFSSPPPSFIFITTWLVSKATSLVNRLLVFRTLKRTTRRISDSDVTRCAIRLHSEENRKPPNECKLPRSRGKDLAIRANDDTGQKSPRRGNTRLPQATTYMRSGSASSQMQMNEIRRRGERERERRNRETREPPALRRRSDLPAARSRISMDLIWPGIRQSFIVIVFTGTHRSSARGGEEKQTGAWVLRACRRVDVWARAPPVLSRAHALS